MQALCSLEYQRRKKQNSTFSLSIKFYIFLSFVSFGDFWFPLSLWVQTQEGLCLQVPRDMFLVETAREVAGHHHFIFIWIESVQRSP